MDPTTVAANVASNEMIKELTGLAQARSVSSAGTAVLDQVLEVQQKLAAQLLQSMGVGGSLDLFV